MTPAVLDFPAATGCGQGAIRFVAFWLAPLFGDGHAIDSRLVDGLWVHQVHEPETDTNALRAQLAAAWQRRRDLDAKEWDS